MYSSYFYNNLLSTIKDTFFYLFKNQGRAKKKVHNFFFTRTKGGAGDKPNT